MTVTARRNRLLVAVLVALTMTAGVFGAAMLTARVAQADPVYLEPAHATGADPFVPSLLQPAEGAAPVPEMAGTGDQGTCDPATLTAYLNGHPDAAAAWVKALDADPGLSWSGGNKVTVEQISAYVAELTPAVLGGDMQVTNHRFVDGQLAAVQSVLQEGTAVLVDADGTPRVRCACGNPLTPAADTDDESSGTEYVGEPWQGFTYDDDDSRNAEDSKASDDDQDDSDHPVIDCKRGEYRDGDHCVRDCPRGSYRDDDGRCKAPIKDCDRDKHTWCNPPKDCDSPQKSHADGSAAPAGDRHGPPCRPQCPDGDKSNASSKHCAPPPSLPCPDGTDCHGQPPTCPVPGTDAVTAKKVDPCAALPNPGKPAAEGTPDAPDSEPAGPTEGSTDPKKPAGDPALTLPGLPLLTDGGKEAGKAPALPLPSAPAAADPPSAAPETKPEAKPESKPPAVVPVPLPAPLDSVLAPPSDASPPEPPAKEGKPEPEAKPAAPASKPAPAPAEAKPAPAPAKPAAPAEAKPAPALVKPAVPAPPAAKPVKPTVKPAVPAPATTKPAPVAVKPAVPVPAAIKSALPVAKPAPAKAVVKCPGGTAMPAAGCAIPATGVPAGWVQRGARMVPA